jgi:hypothetical protein
VISSNPMVPAITLSSDDADDVRASAGSSKFFVVEELMTTVRRMSSPCVGSKDEAATASVVVSTSPLTVKDIVISDGSELVNRGGTVFGASAVLMEAAEVGSVSMVPSVANAVTTVEVCGESESGEEGFDVVSATVLRETMVEDSSWSPGLLEALLGTHCG